MIIIPPFSRIDSRQDSRVSSRRCLFPMWPFEGPASASALSALPWLSALAPFGLSSLPPSLISTLDALRNSSFRPRSSFPEPSASEPRDPRIRRDSLATADPGPLPSLSPPGDVLCLSWREDG